MKLCYVVKGVNMAVEYVIGHWTGGGSKPNSIDLNSYQLLIDTNGKLYNGKPQGKAASVGGMNSITCNISCCGGGTIKLTTVQCERFFKECAVRLKQYGLTPDKFYTHHEIGEMCRDKTITKLLPYNKYLEQNIGKIDLTVLPYDLKGKKSGDFIRNKILWYFQKI